MKPTDQLRHMLFALHNHEPDAFEDELQEIVLAIKENKFYEISKNELLGKPDNPGETINMVFLKDPSVLEKNGLI